jgi:hypothetical protein
MHELLASLFLFIRMLLTCPFVLMEWVNGRSLWLGKPPLMSSHLDDYITILLWKIMEHNFLSRRLWSIIEATCGRFKGLGFRECGPKKKKKNNNKSLKTDVKVFETLSFCQSEQSTLHTKHNLKAPSPTREKRGAPLLHDTTSCWLHGNSIPKIGWHYFWPRQIALPNNTLPILLLIVFHIN